MIVDNQLGAPANWRIDSQTILMQKTTVTPGGTPWEKINASRKIAGFKAGEAEPWTATGTPVLDGKFTMAQLMAIRNATIEIDMGNGDVHVLHGARCCTLPKHESDEGIAGELTFMAMDGETL